LSITFAIHLIYRDAFPAKNWSLFVKHICEDAEKKCKLNFLT